MTGPVTGPGNARAHRPVVGLLGGYGAAGSHAGPLLRDWDIGDLRVGGRDRRRCAEAAATIGATAVPVDVRDPASLAAFTRGCDVVVNCAGPSRELSAIVAAAALVAGADLVDAGGDDVRPPSPDLDGRRRIVLGAGGLPGLSGLLPRRLATELDLPPRTLTAWYAVRDAFTPVAAADYLDGVLGPGSVPRAGWSGGQRRVGVAAPREDVELPFVPGPTTLLPYLDAEGESLARDLRVESAAFFTAVGPGLAAALERVRGQDRADAVESVRRAAGLDVAGRAPAAVFVVELGRGRTDPAAGPTGTRTAVLRAPGISALTGATAAAAALAVLRGEVPPGVYSAAAVLDPVVTLDRLAAAGALTLAVHPCGLDALTTVEEGAL